MTQYHEPVTELAPGDRDVVRALASLKEEIEAVDWYHQRAATTENNELKAILIHNRDEEIEHAAMALEWLRRAVPAFDEQLRTYLFTEAPITEIEEDDDGEGDTDTPGNAAGESGTAGLGIGKL